MVALTTEQNHGVINKELAMSITQLKPIGSLRRNARRTISSSVAIVAVVGLITLSMHHNAHAGSSYQWSLSRIGINKTMHKNAREKGTNVKVGVMDGLARCTHKELKGRCRYYENSGGTYNYWDSHGTHVATTIAASNTGKGQNLQLWHVR